MKVKAERWGRIQELFYAATDLPPSERTAFLEARCGGEATLLAGVQSLILSSESPAETGLGDSLRLLAASSLSAAPGERFGSYEIIREIGRGGMGSVFLAIRADDQYRKQVAIKLMNVAIAGPDMQARFRRERQILADLDHPNIARMLDGGSTPSGLPYVVMEYVEGLPIDVYCRERNLNLRQILGLFRELCKALIYAHGNLIVHRDIKPANILVAADGSPKLLDFGIARLVADNAAAMTLDQERLMTPFYASPEQVRGEPITTAADVYSLGILLHELLTGERPIAGQRPHVDADVANILMMAIREEPSRRYSSVDQFSEDIRRYLEGFPVMARRDTWGYRTSRFVRRHPWSIAASAAFLALLIVFSVAMALLARRVTAERDIANVERANSEQVTRFLIGSFQSADRSGTEGRRLTAEEVLNRGSDRIFRELASQPVVQARMMTTMGAVYESLGLYDRAQLLLSSALHIDPSAQTLAALGHVAETRGAVGWYRKALAREWRPAERATVQAGLGAALSVAGKPAEAESVLNESLRTRTALFGPTSAPVADALFRLGRHRHFVMDVANAESFLRRSLDIRLKTLGPENPETVENMAALSVLLGLMGKASEAESMQVRAIALHRKLYGESHVVVAADLDALGSLLYDSGQYARAAERTREALKMYEATLGPGGAEVANMRIHLGNTLERMGNQSEAAENIRAGLALQTKLLGPDHPLTVSAEYSLAATLRSAGKYAEAEKIDDHVISWQRAHSPDDVMLGYSLALRATLKRARGDFLSAEKDFSDSAGILKQAYGEKHLTYARSITFGALNRMSLGDLKGSEVTLRKAVAICRNADHSNPSDLSFSLVGLAQNLLLQGHPEQAEPLAREAWEVRRKTLPPADQRFALSESVLGGCLAALHRDDEARPLLTESHRNLLRFQGDRSLAPELRRLAAFVGSGR